MRQQIEISFYDFRNWPKMFHLDVFKYLKSQREKNHTHTERETNNRNKNRNRESNQMAFVSISFVIKRPFEMPLTFGTISFDILVTF